jgi:hypothetical protein
MFGTPRKLRGPVELKIKLTGPRPPLLPDGLERLAHRAVVIEHEPLDY